MNVGLIGGGNISDTHARAAQAAGLTLVGVCGDNHTRVRELAGRYGIVAYDTLDALVLQTSIDIVMIGSPSGCHAEQARTAALAGCHVLVEKPLDISTARIDKLLHKVERAGVTLGVIFQDRLKPDVVAMKRQIDAGDLGTPLLVDRRSEMVPPAGVLLQLALARHTWRSTAAAR